MLVGQVSGNNTLIWMYGADNSKIGFTYNGTEYYYIRNLQGDVDAIADENGNIVVVYEYNEWGEVLSITGSLADTIGQINPIRYRGYYYDTETGFYYLQSRYYDPVVKRFINADSVIPGTGESVQGYNLFAYCFNNPVNMSDPSGNWPKWFKNVANWVSDNIINPVVGFINKCLTVKLDVPLYNQGSTSLCWAYNQVMIEDYREKRVRTPDGADARAYEIAVDKFGKKNWNQGGFPDNTSPLRSVSLISLYISLKIHGPLYASYGQYIDGDRVQGHSVVVTGVDLVKGRVYTNNPWGLTGDQSYEEFLRIFEYALGTGWKLENCYYLN